MYKATADAHQFMDRVAMHSTKGSRRGFGLLGHGCNAADVLTPEQVYESIVARLHSLEAEALKWPKNSQMRIGFGLEKKALQDELQLTKLKRKKDRDVNEFFICAAKERLSKAVIMSIFNDAHVLMEEARAKTRAEIAELEARLARGAQNT